MAERKSNDQENECGNLNNNSSQQYSLLIPPCVERKKAQAAPFGHSLQLTEPAFDPKTSRRTGGAPIGRCWPGDPYLPYIEESANSALNKVIYESRSCFELERRINPVPYRAPFGPRKGVYVGSHKPIQTKRPRHYAMWDPMKNVPGGNSCLWHCRLPHLRSNDDRPW